MASGIAPAIISGSHKFIARNEKIVREMVELLYFFKLGLRKEGGWTYQLTFKHTDEDDLKRQFSELLDNIWSTANGYYCIVESDVDEGPDYLMFC